MVALLSYNVGIMNNAISGKNWNQISGRYNKLRKDVADTFYHDASIQIMLISEFGEMLKKLSDVEQI